jgi:nicotinamide mononucleotide transporter
VIAVLVTAFLNIVVILFGWPQPGIIEQGAVFTSFMCTWLCVKQSRWNYPVGVISTILLAIVFLDQKLLGSAALNIYLIPTLIYGWFIWGKDEETKTVTRLDISRAFPVYILVAGIVYGGAVFIIEKLGGELAGLDAMILFGSILAQFLLDRKKLETWFVWMIVNVISIYVYFNAGLYLLTLQFVYFLFNAILGYNKWKSTTEGKPE